MIKGLEEQKKCMEKTSRMSLDCEPLDRLLEGGIEEGVITNIYGKSGTGKTNVCIQAVASCLRDEGRALYVDTEGGFSAERLLQIHEREEALEDVVLMEPTTFQEQEQVFNRIEEMVEEEGIDLVVIDSLVALYRIELPDEVSESNRELSRQLSVLSKIARKKDIPIMVTNQVYSSFESDEVTMVGKDVPTYWSKCLIKLEKKAKNIRKAVLKKHRSRPEGLEEEFSIKNNGLFPSDGEGIEIL